MRELFENGDKTTSGMAASSASTTEGSTGDRLFCMTKVCARKQ